MNKMLQNCKNISTDGKVMSKIKVASSLLGHGVLPRKHLYETRVMGWQYWPDLTYL